MALPNALRTSSGNARRASRAAGWTWQASRPRLSQSETFRQGRETTSCNSGSWPRDRVLELAPAYWAQTRARIDPLELEAELGFVTVPPVADPAQQSLAGAGAASAARRDHPSIAWLVSIPDAGEEIVSVGEHFIA
jgi:hypothetical protein